MIFHRSFIRHHNLQIVDNLFLKINLYKKPVPKLHFLNKHFLIKFPASTTFLQEHEMRQEEASIVETIKLGFLVILKFSILTDILPVKLCMESNLKSTLKWKPSKRRVGRGYHLRVTGWIYTDISFSSWYMD